MFFKAFELLVKISKFIVLSMICFIFLSLFAFVVVPFAWPFVWPIISTPFIWCSNIIDWAFFGMLDIILSILNFIFIIMVFGGVLLAIVQIPEDFADFLVKIWKR